MKKTKPLLILGTIFTSLLALNAIAIEVDFIEGSEGDLVTINYNPTDWYFSFPQRGDSRFIGFLKVGSNLGAGSYSVGLREFAGGPLSDWVTVTWQSDLAQGQDVYFTTFTMTFQSDIEGQTLEPPAGGLDLTVLETGGLQTFQVPFTPAAMIVGMQSDPPESVPESGATVVMLGLALVSTFGCKRVQTLTRVH